MLVELDTGQDLETEKDSTSVVEGPDGIWIIDKKAGTAKRAGEFAPKAKEQSVAELSMDQYQESVKGGYKGTYYQWETSQKKTTKTATETDAEQKKAMRGEMAAVMNSRKGTDRKLSPEDWNALKAGWLQEGGTAKDFDDDYNSYINQSRIEEYDYSPY